MISPSLRKRRADDPPSLAPTLEYARLSYVRRVVGNHRGRFDLQLRPILDQRRDLDGRHRRIMAAEHVTIHAAKRVRMLQIFALVDHVPRHAHDVLGSRARFGEHVDDILQRAVRLSDEFVGLELLLRVPADLAADDDQRAARRDAVRVAFRRRPSGWLKYFHGSALAGGAGYDDNRSEEHTS